MREIIVFADQSANSHAALAEACRRHDNVHLQDFLHRATEALKREADCRLQMFTDNIGLFSPEELIQDYAILSTSDAAFECALLCMSQFAHFISIYGDRSPPYPRQTPETCLAGIGLGLIVANAVASADSLPALIPLAVESVLVGFRLGLYLQHAALELGCNALGQHWSKMFHQDEIIVQHAMNRFHQQENVQPCWKLRLSMVTLEHVMVSGPASVLAEFSKHLPSDESNKRSSGEFYEVHQLMHLIPPSSIDTHVLCSSTKKYFNASEPCMPFFSGSSIKPLAGMTPFESLRSAIREITTSTSRWTELFEGRFPSWRQTLMVVTPGSILRNSSVLEELASRNFDITYEDLSEWVSSDHLQQSSDVLSVACVRNLTELKVPPLVPRTHGSSKTHSPETKLDLALRPAIFRVDSGYASEDELPGQNMIGNETTDLAGFISLDDNQEGSLRIEGALKAVVREVTFGADAYTGHPMQTIVNAPVI